MWSKSHIVTNTILLYFKRIYLNKTIYLHTNKSFEIQNQVNAFKFLIIKIIKDRFEDGH